MCIRDRRIVGDVRIVAAADVRPVGADCGICREYGIRRCLLYTSSAMFFKELVPIQVKKLHKKIFVPEIPWDIVAKNTG